MAPYILRRLLLAIPTLLGVAVAVFFMMRVMPGDAVLVRAAALQEAGQTLDEEAMARIRHELGLDVPVPQQFVVWLGDMARGDFGTSYFSQRPVGWEIAQRAPVTLELALLAITVAVAIGLPAAVISASRQDTWLDQTVRLISVAGLAMPGFWIGTLLVVLPAVWFHWMPPPTYSAITVDPSRNLQQFIPAALALGYALSAIVMRMGRSSLLEVLRQDYIRTAWAKGLRERTVVYRHALKNAFIPVVTILGTQIGHLMAGAIIIETVFGLPGIGSLTRNAIVQRDYPQVQANVMLIATIFVGTNLLVDLVYAWLDPRIRYS